MKSSGASGIAEDSDSDGNKQARKRILNILKPRIGEGSASDGDVAPSEGDEIIKQRIRKMMTPIGTGPTGKPQFGEDMNFLLQGLVDTGQSLDSALRLVECVIFYSANLRLREDVGIYLYPTTCDCCDLEKSKCRYMTWGVWGGGEP